MSTLNKNAAAAVTATALRIQSVGGTQMLNEQHITLPGIANTFPQRLRKIADAIDGAEHCTRAAQLREIARDIAAASTDLMDQAQALDGFFQAPVMERPTIIGRAMGAIRSAATKIIGFEAAHADTKAVA